MREATTFFAFLGSLIAQVEMPDTLPTGILTALTSGSILGWYLWYNVTRVLPEKDRQMQAAIDRLMENFREEMQLERESHRAEVSELKGRVQ